MLKLYLSSLFSDAIERYKSINPGAEINVLQSYALATKDTFRIATELREKGLVDGLLLDSGAFTLNMNVNFAEKVTFGGFLSYCKSAKDLFDHIFNFDENFSAEGYKVNSRNQKKLEDAGIAVVPVIHDYQNQYNEVDTLISEGHEVIALGYSEEGNKKEKYIKSLAKKIRASGSKVHLLGKSDFNLLKKIPLDMVDSSNWAQGTMYGMMYYFEHGTDTQTLIRFWDKEYDDDKPLYWDHITGIKKKHLVKYLQDLGITYRHLMGKKKYMYRNLVNIHHFVIMQDKLREIYAKMEANEKAAESDSNLTQSAK